LLIGEVKRNQDRLNLGLLQNKSKNLIADYPNYKIEWLGLSLEDVRDKW